MPEFTFTTPDGQTVNGVVATDATEDLVQDLVLADLPHAKPGKERHLEESQIRYTVAKPSKHAPAADAE